MKPPTPMRIAKVNGVIHIIGSGGGSLATTDYPSHADFLVLAGNAYEDMLKALIAAQLWMDTGTGGMTARANTYQLIEHAIARAKGVKSC